MHCVINELYHRLYMYLHLFVIIVFFKIVI